jgi:replication fork protection complex subunit Tof1/Swi1
VDVVYRPGDSVLSVLRDLKKLWRKDDTDDERTVFRCFAKAGLCTELVALLEECTGRGDTGRKIALAAADLLAALTWPIDVQRELQDMLEDAEVVVSDYASLLRSQVEYKVSASQCSLCQLRLTAAS